MRPQGNYDRRRTNVKKSGRSIKDYILPAAAVILLIIVIVLAVLVFKQDPAETTPPSYTVTPALTDPTNEPTLPPTDEPTLPPTDEPTPTAVPGLDGTARLQFMGDFLLHETTTLRSAEQGDGTYSYTQFFTEIDPYINGDMVLANTDVLIDAYGDGSRISSYPRFNSPRAIAEAARQIGITGLITCNNHALDSGFEGLKNSCRAIRECGLDAIGAYETQDERNNYYFIKEYNGIKIGVLCYCDWVNNTDEYAEYPFSLKWINHTGWSNEFAMMRSDIQKIRELGAEFVVVSMHWGVEYDEPNSTMKQFAQVLAEAGADVIMGTHPHVVQSVTYRDFEVDGKQKKVLIAYSLGNFFADQRGRNLPDPTPADPDTEQGVILTVDIRRNENGEVVISDASYLPTYTFRRQISTNASGDPIYMYQVLPAGKYALAASRDPFFQNDSEWQDVKNAWNATTAKIGSVIRADAGN